MAQKNDTSHAYQKNNINQNAGTGSSRHIQNMAEDNTTRNSNENNKSEQSIIKNLEAILDTYRRQYLKSEQQIQDTLNQASYYVMDAKRLENLYTSALELEKAAQMGLFHSQNSAKDYFPIIYQMINECHKQQAAMDMQVISSMQQAVMALAQAQATLLASQTLDQMFDSILKCRESLTKLQEQQS